MANATATISDQNKENGINEKKKHESAPVYRGVFMSSILEICVKNSHTKKHKIWYITLHVFLKIDEKEIRTKNVRRRI